MYSPSLDAIRVLHVDDEPDLSDMVATFVERENDRLSVTTATDAEEALGTLDGDGFDCIVSDYNMPGLNGIEFLREVREDHPDLPFILFTGKGSEEVASRAISAGVTDYIQKDYGTDQYALLANKVVNAVEGAHAERAQRRNLRAIETAQEGISIIDSSGLFTYVNQAYADLYGRTREGMIGEPFEITYPPGEVDVLHGDVIPALEEAGFWHGETMGLRADGSTFVEDHTLATTEEGDFVCSVRDKTERKANERAIEGLHSTVRALMEAEAPDEMIETTVRAVSSVLGLTVSTGYRYDPEADRLSPVARTDRAADLVGDLDPIDRGDGVAWEVYESGERRTYEDAGEADLPYPDAPIGSAIFIPLGDHGLLFVGSEEPGAFDETDEGLVQTLSAHATTALDGLRSERELREEREFIDQAIATLNDVFFVLDTDGSLRQWNDRLREVSGYGESRISEMAVEEFFPERQRAAVSDAVSETLTEGQATFEAELCTEESGCVPYEFESARLTATDGAVTGVVGLGRDVSRRKAHERQLRAQNERLDEFASIISHDLRNPLAVANGRLEMARRECESDHLDAVERAHDRMDTLISDILSIAREGETALEREAVDLAAVAEECWQHVETGSATLAARADQTVMADRTQLQQLLENCFRNAVEHGGPDVTVTVGDRDDGFYVADDGEGVPADVRNRVFEPGFSTTPDGTGLGLDIVAGIVDSHDWEIAVTDGDSGGARFDVEGVETAD